jgi:hypothetical protein
VKTIVDIIQGISAQLQDQRHFKQYTRWTQAMLVGYLNDGLAEVSGLRPDLFATLRQVTLDVGFLQTIPEDCASITRVEANSDGSMVYAADAELMRAQGSVPPCQVKLKYDAAGNVVFKVRSFAVDSTNPKVFYVSPAVPAGVKPKVTLAMVLNPPTYSTNRLNEPVDFAPIMYVLLNDYMMARAYDIDTESAESRSNSIAHFTKFYQFFGMSYKAQGAYRSTNYEGRTAAGNPSNSQ